MAHDSDDPRDVTDPGAEPETDADADADAAQLEAFDLDGDGKISVIEAERARLGVVDARLEELAGEHGIKGALAEAAHKIVDKLDNDD